MSQLPELNLPQFTFDSKEAIARQAREWNTYVARNKVISRAVAVVSSNLREEEADFRPSADDDAHAEYLLDELDGAVLLLADLLEKK
jgi:hypothetical protein